MNLLDVVHRISPPEPWAEGEKIPWNDPKFSQRMLNEHLSQAHDAASRRFEKIDQHVAWIHDVVLAGQTGKILDLGCGPGLYASRMAQRGHECVGIDFSPASIAYAKAQVHAAAAELDGTRLACAYTQSDIRRAVYGTGFDLAMFIFGEFNVFTREDAALILRKMYAALKPGGKVLLEPHTFEAVEREGRRPASWYSTPSGLFSPQPHMCLTENFWDEENAVAIIRHYIVDAISGDVTRHSASMLAYTPEQYTALLTECGFEDVTHYPSLTGKAPEDDYGLCAIVGQKPY